MENIVTENKHKNATKFGKLPSTISLMVREPGSAFTHGFALLMCLIGSSPLLMRADLYGSSYTVAGMWIFIISACMLYSASTIYHSVVLDEKKTNMLRKFDHMSISILIAGTYTPICLTVMRDSYGIPMLIAIWSLAIIGIVIKGFWITCPTWVSSVLYLGMGWLCIAFLPALVSRISPQAFAWLLTGGISYSVGAIIYALKLDKFNSRHIYFGSHEIFHLFIMGGTFCHYMMLNNYIIYFG